MRKVEAAANGSARPAAGLNRLAVQASALALAIAWVAPAAAQSSESPPSNQAPGAVQPTADEAAGQIGDVIVTARRTEERLQDIPASVSAITGADVARLQSLADVQSVVSGVTFQAIGPVPVVGIRGFGNRSTAGNPSNSAVGIFQDGVFVASALTNVINRTDTERLEVAKGPQSTLYGRSSFTGAFNIVTTDPGDVVSGYIDAGYGFSSVDGEDLWRIQGAVSLPVNDTLAVRFYGLAEKRDGYVLDPTTGFRSGGYDRQVGRIKLLWKPSDTVTARLSGTILRDDTPFPFVTAGRVRAPLGQNILFANPASPAARGALRFSESVYDGQLQTRQRSKIEGEQVTLDLRFETPIGELASLTDYQNARLAPFFSLDLTRLNWANGSSPYDEKRWSQELRLANTTGRLSYLAGLYVLNSKVSQGGGKVFNPDTPFASFSAGSAQFDLARINAIYQPSFTETQAFAAFAQVGFDITDSLNLTVGIRQAQDEIAGTAGVAIRNLAGVVIPTVPMIYRRAVFDATTGNAVLSYDVAEDVIVYGSYARGNSPGGLNAGAAARINFGPQNVDAFELGLKSRLLDRKLQLNLALFENRYSDLQLSQNLIINGAITPLVTNAAKARGRGFDVDALAVVSPNLRAAVQYTYVKSEITSYDVPPPPAPQVNLDGVPLVRSPKHSLNASVTFSTDIGPGRLELTAEENYTSGYTNDYLGVPAGTAYPGIPGVLPPGVTTTQVLGLFRNKGFALTNLSARYSWNDWEFRGSVRNLFDKEYIAAVLAFDLITNPLETPGRPQTFEFGIKYKF